MKNIFIAMMAILLFTGCATTSEMEALENRVSALERSGSSSSNAAESAGAAADRASREASAAQSAAERALDAANEANERIQRMSETCCARK